MSADLEYCLEMIEAEDLLATAAPSEEVSEMHQQMVMLYRAQAEHLRRAAVRDQRH